MDILDVIKKPFYLSIGQVVTEITEPLLKAFRLSYFNHIRIINNKYYGLFTDYQWCRHFFKTQYPVSGTRLSKSGVYLYKDYMPDCCVRDSISFDQHNRIIILHKSETMTEYFGFATSDPNFSLITFYINHIDLFEQFILYFKDKTTDLMNEAYAHHLILTNNRIAIPKTEPSLQALYKALDTKNIRLTMGDKSIVLSRREFDCIKQLAQGKTMKVIARDLNLSCRTIETHIYNAKQKANCSRSKLIDLLHDNITSPTTTRILLPLAPEPFSK